MITSLRIKNFRGVPDLLLDDLGRLNVVVGKNNVGKSSVLEAIAIAVGAVNQDSSVLKGILGQVLKWRGWLGRTSINFLFTTPYNPIELTFTSDNVPYSVVIRHRGEVSNILERTHNLKLDIETLKKMMGESIDVLNFEIKAGPLTRTSLVLISENGNSIVMSSGDEPYPVELPIEFVTPYDTNAPGFIETAFSKAFKAKSYHRALELIRRAYPEVENLSPVPEGNGVLMYVDIKHSSQSVPYYVMGDGFKFLSAIAFLVSSVTGGHFLIDSAEAFHHPKSLRTMVRTLIEGSLKNDVQVFLTTHSLELLDMLLEEGIEAGIDGRVVYMKREGENPTYSVETFENSKELREDLGVDLRG